MAINVLNPQDDYHYITYNWIQTGKNNILSSDSSYKIETDNSNFLMAFGVNDNQEMKDLTLYKKNYSAGYCQKCCYSFGKGMNIMTGKMWFNVKRIVVYQLK